MIKCILLVIARLLGIRFTRPNLARFLGRLSNIPLMVFTDCLGDNPTDLRLALQSYLALPRAKVLLERSVAALEAGKTEISFLLTVLAGEASLSGKKFEIFAACNAAPRPKGTKNNVGCQFVYAEIHAGNAIIHYFGTFGEELSLAYRLGLIHGEIWKLAMQEGVPFRSKMLAEAIARAISGDMSVYEKIVDPATLPTLVADFVGGKDRFGNLITTFQPGKGAFATLKSQTVVTFRLGEREFKATFADSFGSGDGLMIIPGSAVLNPRQPEVPCLYLVITGERATDLVGDVPLGTPIQILAA